MVCCVVVQLSPRSELGEVLSQSAILSAPLIACCSFQPSPAQLSSARYPSDDERLQLRVTQSFSAPTRHRRRWALSTENKRDRQGAEWDGAGLVGRVQASTVTVAAVAAFIEVG